MKKKNKKKKKKKKQRRMLWMMRVAAGRCAHKIFDSVRVFTRDERHDSDKQFPFKLLRLTRDLNTIRKKEQ